MGKIICGIQQIGIGIPNVQQAFTWYRKTFGTDIRVFEEAAVAALMLPYTDGKPQSRHAILAINLQGGGGFEIWQYTGRKPQPAGFEIQAGDLGIFMTKIKCKNVEEAVKQLSTNGVKLLGGVTKDPAGAPTAYLQDPYGNIFQLVHFSTWFKNENRLTGGVGGAVIGVTDIEKSRKLYTEILGYDTVVYDSKGKFEDYGVIPGGSNEFRRVLLRHKATRKGAFSRLIGPTEIELIQVTGRSPKKIFENRLWGDLGFIHLCFDIAGMADLKKECESKGFRFTVDSANSFDMGEAAGHFAYIEDPDGTLIEFVETHKVPVLKKIGWYLNLKNRDPERPLPDWMVKAMGFSRVKD